MESVTQIIGDKFTGTIVEDEILDPYFIKISDGYTVARKRVSAAGKLVATDECYPSTFMSCLDRIARRQLHEDGKLYSSLQEYIDTWKEISGRILNAYKDWKVERI